MTQDNLERLHRFHCYSARFPTEIAQSAIASFTKKGECVYDPFCGSGTTLVAALALGRSTIGSDIDRLAGILSQLKVNPLSPKDYFNWRVDFLPKLDECLNEIESAWPTFRSPAAGEIWKIGRLALSVPELDNLLFWFPPQVTAALAAISNLAHQSGSEHFEKVILASLSACVIAKWPNTLSYAMDIDHTRPHRRIQKISMKRVKKTFLSRLDRTLECLGHLWEIYQEEKGAAIAKVLVPCDARSCIAEISDRSQRLIVTSPPYFNAVDYPRAHRLSLCWMNGYASQELGSRKDYVGIRGAGGIDHLGWLSAFPKVKERLGPSLRNQNDKVKPLVAFFSDLERVLGENWRVLRNGGYAIYVIANNVIGKDRLPSHLILSDIAKSVGFERISIRSRPIKTMRRRFPVGPFGFDGPMTHEYVVTVKKPTRVRKSRTP
jgi:DNA modification methylase